LLAACLISTLLAPALAFASTSSAPSENLKIWFEDPADRWEESLPVGNGRLGGMVFGGPNHERIQLNEDSLWSGRSFDRINPAALQSLPEIRRLLHTGDPVSALRLADRTMMSDPIDMPPYRPLGDLWLDFAGIGATQEYRRELDLDTAIAGTSYRSGATLYTREVFSSAADQVLVIRIVSSAPGKLFFATSISRQEDATAIAQASGEIVMGGREDGGQGMEFAAIVKVLPSGGRLTVRQSHVFTEGADSAVILIVAATGFGHRDPLAVCRDQITRAARKSYAQLRQAHLADYQALFRRVDLKLEGPGTADAAGDPGKRTARWNARLLAARSAGGRPPAPDPRIATLYFQFARYLLISSSRPGTLAANMQGIWNDLKWPPWESKYTININIQMNYWPAEPANLGELHLPLFDLIDTMRGQGRETAKKMYGARGIVAHHNTDIWGDVAPIDGARWGLWPMGLAWLSLHEWDHYDFTRDREFLAKRAYPVMREAAEFLLDYMVQDPRGRLVTGPSVSPENSYRMPNGETGVLSMGPSMDRQIAYALFTRLIQAAEILGRDAEFREQLIVARDRLPQPQIGRHGQLMEWLEDYDEPEPGHRHVSHLFALFPGNQITPRGTPELAQAARTSLERRLAAGGGSTGWSRAWIVNLYARLGDGDEAHANLVRLLEAHTLPNLLDYHPPYRYQMDGNMGGASGILEMLLQSHTGEIEFLPALPRAWPSGHFRGLRARGGIEVDLNWDHGRAIEAEMRPTEKNTFRLRAPQRQSVVSIRTADGPVEFRKTGDNVVEVAMEPQRSYRIIFQ
jgi:alpha-L-fucosidase 2